MSSSPLFIKVAESMVTFAPIDQLGCLSACSTVALLTAAALAVRNGPPEAVRITRRTSWRRLPLMAWNRALCSESTGSTVAPAAAARRMNSAPAQTSVSLFASATIAPRSAAASVGLRPAAPVIAPITHSVGRLDQTAFARPRRDSAPGQRRFEIAIASRIAHHRETRAQFARERGKRFGVRIGAHGLHAKTGALALEQVDGAGADRTGGAE